MEQCGMARKEGRGLKRGGGDEKMLSVCPI